jgi:uncharacterized membrane protein
MKDYSLTIASLIVLVAGLVGWGDIISEAEVGSVINSITEIVAVVGVWYGRYRQGDVSALGFKK